MARPGKDKFWDALEEGARLALFSWREELPYQVEPVEWLDGGESGSRVAVIVRHGPGFGDQVAIKFSRPSGVNAWQAAMEDCPATFRRQHLVDSETASYQYGLGKDGWWITTLKIAGGDLSLFRPLAELSPNKGRQFGRTCGNIVKSLIAEWNPRPLRSSPESISRTDTLSGTFDSSRIVPGKPLWTWFETIKATLDDPFVSRPKWDEPLPNPIALAANADRLDGDGQRGVQYGRAHGDLHLRNILIQVSKPRSNQYKLIDLDRFNSRSPLARDPMHLLLSVALEWLNSGINPGSEIARSLIEVIVRPREETAEKEYQEVGQAIHEAGYEWALEDSWGREWTQQSLLFLMGCALRFSQ